MHEFIAWLQIMKIISVTILGTETSKTPFCILVGKKKKMRERIKTKKKPNNNKKKTQGEARPQDRWSNWVNAAHTCVWHTDVFKCLHPHPDGHSRNMYEKMCWELCRLEKISEVWKSSWQWSFDLSTFNTTDPDICFGNTSKAIADLKINK